VDIVGVLMSSIVELAFIGAGTYGIVTTFLLRSQGNKSKVWPITEGIITSTRIDEREDKYNEYGPATLYYPEINYSYEFGGVQYTSSRVSYEGVQCYSDRREAEKWLSRFPKGTRISVHCNPNYPHQSTIKQGLRAREVIIRLCVSSLLGAIAMILFFLYTLPAMSK
jgi:hypothetical protein